MEQTEKNYLLKLNLTKGEAAALNRVVLNNFIDAADAVYKAANLERGSQNYALLRALLGRVREGNSMGNKGLFATEKETLSLLRMLEAEIARWNGELASWQRDLEEEGRASEFAEPAEYKELSSLEDKVKDAAILEDMPLGYARQEAHKAALLEERKARGEK